MKQQFIVNTSDTFKTWIYENNRRLAPSSARITVFWPGEDLKLVDDEAMAIASDGLLSYDLTASQNSEPAENYRAAITYIHNGTTSYATLFYDIVKTRLVKVITDDDLASELPQLKDRGWRVRGTADSGTTATIADGELKRYEDDYFTGGTAYSFDKDETREITAFVRSTGTITTEAFSSAILAGEKYLLTRSFSREIQRAFEKAEERITRLGRRPHLILDPYDLREVHIYQSVAEACKGLINDNESLWREMWKEYEKKAEDSFRNINFKYDSSGDGRIGANETDSAMSVIRTARV